MSQANHRGGHCYLRPVAFCDTDAMEVVHHSNYLKYCEEARVNWMRSAGIEKAHYPFSDMVLAIISSRCRHLAPLRFGDEIEIRMQVRTQGLRIFFQYAIYQAASQDLVALAETELVPLTRELRPIRIPAQLKAQLEKEKWTETWL